MRASLKNVIAPLVETRPIEPPYWPNHTAPSGPAVIESGKFMPAAVNFAYCGGPPTALTAWANCPMPCSQPGFV